MMDSKIKVFYDVCPKVQTFVQLRISNEYGFVEDATACFCNQNFSAQEKVRLFYTAEESTNDDSTFKGVITFENSGKKFFFISLLLNGNYQEIRYDQSLKKGIFSKDSSSLFELYVCDMTGIRRLFGKELFYIDMISQNTPTC